MRASKYRSAITELSRLDAAAASGPSATSGQEVNSVVARHGRSRPLPPPASSTRPYLASCRRWKEQLAELSPISSPAWVAVSGPSRRSTPISDSLIGCAMARRARGSVSRVTDRGAPTRLAVGLSSAMDAKIAFES